ncbi:MAG: recombinase family protein [Oscillospiraceae bacterium]|jgi:DNA invertase Pin-like site-specific DNA recombinase|nr:recombinase family protein [Oscillospiraceae bacterium]
MAKIGYVRVSTREQHTERQEAMMDRLGVEKIFVDRLSGKNAERTELLAMLNYVREGDTLIVESFSRLSRSLKDFLWILDMLEEKGVKLISQKETVDTSTPMGKFVVQVLGALAEMERTQMLERQAEGIAIAKANGVYAGKGRPARTDIDIEVLRADIERLARGDDMISHICRRHKISRSTFYRLQKNLSSK